MTSSDVGNVFMTSYVSSVTEAEFTHAGTNKALYWCSGNLGSIVMNKMRRLIFFDIEVSTFGNNKNRRQRIVNLKKYVTALFRTEIYVKTYKRLLNIFVVVAIQ